MAGLSDSPLCRRGGAEDETSPHIVSVKLGFTRTCITGLFVVGASGH
jgi:hypothetical protein